MSEQGPGSGRNGGGRKLNGHANGHAKPAEEGRGGPGVVVPFPKRTAPRRSWLAGLGGIAGRPGHRFGALFGWLALIGFAGLFWGIRKDGMVDMIDVFAGLFGVLAALWFYRSR